VCFKETATLDIGFPWLMMQEVDSIGFLLENEAQILVNW